MRVMQGSMFLMLSLPPSPSITFCATSSKAIALLLSRPRGPCAPRHSVPCVTNPSDRDRVCVQALGRRHAPEARISQVVNVDSYAFGGKGEPSQRIAIGSLLRGSDVPMASPPDERASSTM